MKRSLLAFLLLCSGLSAHAQNPNLSNTTPAAPAGNVNVTWQASGTNVSGYVPTPTATPLRYTPAALCSAGSAAIGLVIPPANAPAPGCSNATASPIGYLNFVAGASPAQVAYGSAMLPSGFANATATLSWYADSTAGTVTWTLGVSCLNTNGAATATPVYTSASQTASVSGTADGLVTATFTNVIANGANGCAAGSTVSYSITPSSSSGLSSTAVYLVGVTWTGVL